MDTNDLTLGSEFESQLGLLPLEEEEDEGKTILEGVLPAYVTLPTTIAGAHHPQAPITTEPAAAASTMAKGIPTDPDTMPAGQSQWHLVGTWGLHADLVWGDYTGSGIMVGVMDDGFQYTHHEISANYRTDLDRDIPNADNDPSPVYVSDNHGTSVIGTIIADDNGSGGVGVAFDAQAYGIRLDFGGGGNGIVDTVNGFQYALTTGLDVMNNSWGYTTQYADTIGINFAGPDFIDINNLLGQLTANGRGGLGSNIVFSAGNSRGAGDNVNYHNMQNSPYTIAVAAIDPDGTYSAFSTPGAALLVSAGGTQVYTTDRTGALGYNGTGDYTNFSGTSASAPIVSGAIAVLLEANPNLGWRDVQEILAYSAQFNDSGSAGWQFNGAGNWNGGGLHFSHDYGYGAFDLFRAVRLAETWDLQQTSANQTKLAMVSASPSIAIPATGTITTTINIASDIEIEHVLIDLNISHTKPGDLIVTLISPDGTESVLVNRPENGAFTGIYGFSGIDFLAESNAHWGESSAGIWTLKIQDAAGGNAGTLNSWGLEFWGNTQSNDDLYVYTSDYGAFSGAALTARSTLSDASGTDTINLATITSNTILNMNGGTASTVAGKTLNIAAGTVIENAYLGDGNDTVTGNSANNNISGGRGNDSFVGSAGNDTLDGESGTDLLTYLESIANFTFTFVDAVTVNIVHAVGAAWTDITKNFENFAFTEGSYTRAELEAYAAGGGGGGPGATIMGTPQNDVLNGTAGNDTIIGNAGMDTLYAGAGTDNISGGAGNDNYYFGAAGEAEGDVIEDNGDSTYDRIYFTNLATALNPVFSLIDGNTTDLRVTTAWGTLTLVNQFAGDASDRVEYIYGQVAGGATTGVNLGYTAFDFVGDATGEILTMPSFGISTSYKHTIHGMGGNDTITGSSRTDYLYGGDNDDILNGAGGNDELYGEAGSDVINAGDGDDRIYAGTGADVLHGENGNDYYYFTGAGEAAGDIIEDNGAASSTSDKIYFTGLSAAFVPVFGLASGNTTDLEIRTEWGTVTILNQFAADTSDRIEYVYGQQGGASSPMVGINLAYNTYQFEGSAGNDILNMPSIGISASYIHSINGLGGNDTITGGAGRDRLYGGDGDDVLSGGAQMDYLIGDAGADTFIFEALTAFSGADRIEDLDFSEGDRIDLSDILTAYDPLTDMIEDFVQISNSGTNSLLRVDIDGGGNNFVHIATLVGITGITDEQALVDGGQLIV